MSARTALASIAVFVWVLVIGGLADMHDLRANTTFVLGIVASVPAFLLADGLFRGARRG